MGKFNETDMASELLIHPGETIAEILEERGIMQTELAVMMGYSLTYIRKVIAGEENISTDFAGKLECVLGVSQSFWMNLQENYDAEHLDIRERYTEY